jgi:hypothetical protein
MKEFDKTGRHGFGHMKGGCCCQCECCGHGSEGCGCEGHEPTSEEKLDHLKKFKEALKEKLEYVEKLEKELESSKHE